MPVAAYAAESTTSQLPPIEVVGTTPLPGLFTPIERVPANIQVFGEGALDSTPARSVSDFLDRRATSVNLNAASGNPYQPDLNFRGFTASPVLGTPAGLSVFVDGVRVNELFGDVVNWDLIPMSAIATLQVMPGSNPLYGLNTLGGAIAMFTKDGRRFDGANADIGAGTYGARAATVEAGSARGRIDGYVTAHAYDDSGWREHSASRIRQLFGNVGYRDHSNELRSTVLLARNRLEGTQALPLAMMDRPREAYTWPDVTRNDLGMLTLQGRHSTAAEDMLAVNAYSRWFRSVGVNSNVNPDAARDSAPAAFNVSSATRTRSTGVSAQWSGAREFAHMRHDLTAGLAFDDGVSDFGQASANALFTAQREAVSVEPPTSTVDARTHTQQAGVYGRDVVALSERWAISGAVRYQRARVTIEDRSGFSPALDGAHRFARLTGALGATYQATRSSTLYASITQGMRVPTAAELTCADPQAPCSLPNIFIADPALKPVIATTMETGARGAWQTARGERATWSAAAFDTSLRNDIQFIATGAGAVNTGYFTNVGHTRRSGFELGTSLPLVFATLDARYSYTRAIFASDFVEHSPNNSAADPSGAIVVRKNDRLPGIPSQLLKVRGAVALRSGIELSISLLAASRQYARGNENNRDAAGVVPGYGVIAVAGTWQASPGWRIEAEVSNLFDRRYATFGTLGANFFRGPDNTFAPELASAEAFRGIGAPRTAWLGARYAFQ